MSIKCRTMFVIVAMVIAFPEFAIARKLAIASFNVQFVGSFKKRDNVAVAAAVKGYDIVVIQELVAPPRDGRYPNGNSYKADPEAKAFVDAMLTNGFKYVLSPEDTGTGDKNHTGSTSTEWFITFYKPDAVSIDSSVPNGFLAEDRTNHPDYERVPFAFGFKVKDGPDFVLISVHLKPGARGTERRRQELAAIANWIEAHDENEKDFIILGDMNIENCAELIEIIPAMFSSLNDNCLPTNTNVNSPKPYDHVMFRASFSPEVQRRLTVIDLVSEMRPYWNSPEPYPGQVL